MHPDQLDISVHTACALIHHQFRRWRHEPVTPATSRGTVNTLFRIGDQLSARFPLQPAGGSGDAVDRTRRWLSSEADAARELLGRSRFRTPEPIAIGEPGPGFPLPWAVQTRLAGTVAADDDPGDSAHFAADLALFIRDVRATAPTAGRSAAPGAAASARPRRVDADVPAAQPGTAGRPAVALNVGRSAGAAPHRPGRDDARRPHPGQCAGERRSAGRRPGRGRSRTGGSGTGPGGRVALLEARPRQVLRQELGVDDLEWARGMAWAFEQAMGLVWYYADSNPPMSALGRRTLHRILATSAPGRPQQPALTVSDGGARPPSRPRHPVPSGRRLSSGTRPCG